MNRYTGSSTHQPHNPNKLEARKEDTVSYSRKPNAIRLPTPKTNKIDQQAAETAKIVSELAATAAAISRDDAEQKTFHEAKKAKILAHQAAGEREVMSEFNALKSELALAEEQLARLVAEAKEEPPRRCKKGKLHRANAQAKAQPKAETAANQAEAAERASSDRAEARRKAKRAAKHKAAKQEAAEAHQKDEQEKSARASAERAAAKAQQ